MKCISFMVLILFAVSGCNKSDEYQPQNGDIIFQTSRSSQSTAIQQVTKSKYSHMGIVYVREGRPYVFEAVEPVKLTPLSTWTARGVDGHYVVKRLKDAEEILTPDALERMRKAGEAFTGKHYDLTFEWSDERIYCSELVWKIYKRALNLEIGDLQTMKQFDLSDPLVQAIVRERFGERIPENETVISPAAIFSSSLIEMVYEN